MNKKFIIIFAACALGASFVFFGFQSFLVKRSARLVNITESGYKKDLLRLAESYEEKGEYLKSRRAFAEFVDNYSTEDEEALGESRERIEELNMRLLFSNAVDEDSFIYEIKSGDTLSKVASTYLTPVELIKKSNNLKNDTIYPGQKLKISRIKFRITVDKSENILMLERDNGEIFKTYVVATGENMSTPEGTFTVEEKLVSPIWYKVGAVINPSSSEYELGSRWIGLSIDGYGIHGTKDPSAIGQHVTKGCVRMKNEDVEELYAIVPSGTEVTIVE